VTAGEQRLRHHPAEAAAGTGQEHRTASVGHDFPPSAVAEAYWPDGAIVEYAPPEITERS
jgi:hypothetical protein